MKIYSENCTAQRPHKYKEALSGGKPKHTKSVELKSENQEVNTMESHDEPIPKKIRGKISLKIVRVNRPRQTHQRMGLIIALTA